MALSSLSLCLLSALLSAPVPGDWPQYNGLGGDRRSAESIVQRSFGEQGPQVLWRWQSPGGFSSIAVAGQGAYTLVQDGESEVCVALDADSGKERWRAALGAASYDGGANAGAEGNSGGDGPRSTPSVAGSRVVVLSSALQLSALDTVSGERCWSHDLLTEFEGRNLRWQNAASPLIHRDGVFVAGGGAGQSLLAFSLEDGALRWKAGDHLMTHATPIATSIHGVPQIVFYVQSGLVSVRPEDGTELWRAEFPYRVSSAASPVVSADLVYCSAGYGVGAGCFRIQHQGEEWSAELVWRTPNKNINHWSTPVCVDGRLYGMFSFKKYGTGPLACVDLHSGEQGWGHPGFGPGNVIAVGDLLVALSDAGEVVLVEPNAESYRELARADVLDGKCWSSPSFADGRLYVRSTREAVCIDLRGPAGGAGH